MLSFDVVTARQVRQLLAADPSLAMRAVAAAYLDHHDGRTVNPHSQFLRFPGHDLDRIISLPASLGEASGTAGIKWIASFPGNTLQGLPRASAVLVLNDLRTGYPYALLESSIISAARTAASAVLAATWIHGQVRHAARLSVVGAGVIAAATLDAFRDDGWRFDEVLVHDRDERAAARAATESAARWPGAATRAGTLSQAMEADVVLFATTAGTPYVGAPHALRPGQVVLNVSLRDLDPALILSAQNVFDDVDHCLRASTSPHLAEQACGDRRFVTGTLAQLMRGEIRIDRSKPVVFSPFGMGILDLALGRELHLQARESGCTVPIPDFFGDLVAQG